MTHEHIAKDYDTDKDDTTAAAAAWFINFAAQEHCEIALRVELQPPACYHREDYLSCEVIRVTEGKLSCKFFISNIDKGNHDSASRFLLKVDNYLQRFSGSYTDDDDYKQVYNEYSERIALGYREDEILYEYHIVPPEIVAKYDDRRADLHKLMERAYEKAKEDFINNKLKNV
jgi:hypothetical protein